jgi:hypothetical protein
MHEKAMSEALDAIHDEALKLLECDPPEEVERKLELIASIARYKHDVRGQPDREEPIEIEHEEEYERDGIAYRVYVVSGEGALWGKWHCRACNATGSSSKRCSSVDDAVLAAKTNIGPHHFMTHGEGKRA